jgi:hypothetical protein
MGRPIRLLQSPQQRVDQEAFGLLGRFPAYFLRPLVSEFIRFFSLI